MGFTRSYGGFASKKRTKSKSDDERGKNIIGEKAPKTKDCSIVLPILSTPIFSTVQLVKKSKEVEMENTTNLVGATPTPPEDMKRPIYLGDLIIGYETVSPKSSAPKTNSKTKQRILKRKERQQANENDLTPIVINQRSVLIPDEKGKKHRVNLRQIAKMEEDEIRQKRRKLTSLQGEHGAGTTLPMETHAKTYTDELHRRKMSIDEVILNIGAELNDHGSVMPEEERKKKKRKPKSVGKLKRVEAAGAITDDLDMEEFSSEKNTTLNETNRSNVICTIPTNEDNPFLFGKYDYSKSHASSESEGTEVQPLFPKMSEEEFNDFCEAPVQFELSSGKKSTDFPVGSPMLKLSDVDDGNAQSGIEFITELCNICGQEMDPIEKPSTFVEVIEDTLIYYICITCNQKFSIIERAKHEGECFAKMDDECYYYPSELEGLLPAKETGFRMIACQTCVLEMKRL